MRVRKYLTVLGLAAAAACDGANQPVASPAAGAPTPEFNLSSTCSGPTVVSPTGSTVLTGTSTALTFQMDALCRRVNAIEVYDAASGTLVFSDYTPEFETYQMGTGYNNNFEYRYLTLGGSGVPRGKYYNWRVRTHQVATDGYTVVQVAPWSASGTFGVSPTKPTLSGSISSFKPNLSWTSSDGATQYEVWRYISDWGGSWDVPLTTTSTSFTDTDVCVTSTNTGHYVQYHIEAVNTVSGLRNWSSSKIFYLCGQPPI
ncbi:hypothetical protein [Longimicrobium sp.]|uniref:hypothetical protein n=1 Tax=Longimicrobium sp. TaxID=2029185 RepID=UPI002E339CDB|nr:hypothetical protein [Longimicrobium sp.]HEX6042114.1 hypothetical protein [Longimicrobium sp.]